MPCCSCCGAKRTNIRGCGNTHDCLKGICGIGSDDDGHYSSKATRSMRRYHDEQTESFNAILDENQRLKDQIQELQKTICTMVCVAKPIQDEKQIQQAHEETKQEMYQIRLKLQELELASSQRRNQEPQVQNNAISDVVLHHIAELTPHNVETYLVPGKQEGEA